MHIKLVFMIKNYFFLFSISILFFGCVEDRDLTKNTVIAHILSQPDGLHPCNDNSVMRSFIFNLSLIHISEPTRPY